MHYLGEKVLVDCCNIVGLVEHKFVMPVHIHTLSVVTFLSHGMVVQIVEKPIEGVGSVIAPFHIIYGCETEVFGIHELTERELVVELCILGCCKQTSWTHGDLTFICFNNHEGVIFVQLSDHVGSIVQPFPEKIP